MKRICVCTGSRSEWGLLEPLVEQLDKEFDVQLIITGSHLSKQFGKTSQYIPNKYQGYICPVLADDDSNIGTCHSMAMGLMQFPGSFANINPDCVLLLGDRFEIFAAAIAAYNLGIPIAHIHGGDVTTGSLDDGYRDCITRLSTYHFVATPTAALRIAGIVDHPLLNIHCVGSLGCVFPTLPKEVLKCDYLVVYHSGNVEEFSNIVAVTEHLPNVIYIGSNADAGGRTINELLKLIEENGQTVYINLPRNLYFSLLWSCKCIIGNSSSGIIEAPLLDTPTINIGSRQAGRIRAKSVIDCDGSVEGIKAAIEKAKQIKFPVDNPYYKEDTVTNIVNILKEQL